MLRRIPTNRNVLIMAYKLLYDVLFLIFFSFIVLLVSEGALPGFITSHISLAKITLALLATTGAIIFLGRKLKISYPAPRISKNKSLGILVLMSFLLIGNSMLKFAFWENFIITTLTLLVFFLFYGLIFSPKE